MKQFNLLNLNNSNEFNKEKTNKNIIFSSFFNSTDNSIQVKNTNLTTPFLSLLNKQISTTSAGSLADAKVKNNEKIEILNNRALAPLAFALEKTRATVRGAAQREKGSLLNQKSYDYIYSNYLTQPGYHNPNISNTNFNKGIDGEAIIELKKLLVKKNIKNKAKSFIIYQYLKNCLSLTKISISQYKEKKNGTFLNYNKIIGYNFNSPIANARLQNEAKVRGCTISSKYIVDTYKLLLYLFKSMYCLISKPVFKFTPEKVTIQLFYYLNIPKKKVFKLFSIFYIKSFHKSWLNIKSQQNTFRQNKLNNRSNFNRLGNPKNLFVRWKLRKAISRLKSKSTNIKFLLFKLRKFNLTKVFYPKFKIICDILSNKLKKPVELQLIRLHYPYHDSNILVNLLHLNIKNKRKKSRVAIQKIYSKNAVKKLNDPNLNSINFIPAFLSGLNIKIAGRLMREPIIPRLTTKVFENGATATGKVNYLDVATITKKNRKGAYTIKIASGQNFF